MLAAVDLEGLFNLDRERVGEAFDVEVRGEVGGDDDELVSAEAREGVGGADGAAQLTGDLAQDLVADVMPEGVVYVLEAVEIENEEREFFVCTAASAHGMGEPVCEEAPIGEAGEFVVQGEPRVIGDLLLKHDEDHADGDEGFLHVPDMRGDLGIGCVFRHDPRVREEAKGPDERIR